VSVQREKAMQGKTGQNQHMSFKLPRRSLLLCGLTSAVGAGALSERTLAFPRDFGAHKDFRTEWWYLTGHATSGGRLFGFQLTFFRTRVQAAQGLASRLAARHLVFAHAAVTDVQGLRLWYDQRIAHSSGAAELDLASTSERDTDIVLRDWSLQRSAKDYRAQIGANDFALDLQFGERQRLLLQGRQGLSRKGPDPLQASYYYSQPQLSVQGEITLQRRVFKLDGSGTSAAWLDHEWSQALLHPHAVGWDWIGMNLFDGSALTAFRLRDKTGAALWDGGSFRAGGSRVQDAPYIFSPGEVIFRPLRHWSSPLTRASYPVEWLVRTPADFYTVKAVVDRQELDSRASTGAIYWEGLSDLFDSQGRHVGRGYLEMTGYADVLRM
jgi:predicted secreted hydrolase